MELSSVWKSSGDMAAEREAERSGSPTCSWIPMDLDISGERIRDLLESSSFSISTACSF